MLIPSGLAVSFLGVDLMGACYTIVHPVTGSTECFPGPYLAIGFVVAVAGLLTLIAGVGLLARPEDRYLPRYAEPSRRHVTAEELRLRRRSGVIRFLKALAALVAVEIYLISGLPMGVETTPGHFEYYPTFLLSLIPIVVSDSFVVFILWVYLGRR